jgi:hypothetical protein
MGSIKTTIYLFSLLLLLALVVLSCSKKDIAVAPTPRFVFGTSYGNCLGDCDRYYAVKDGQVYRADGEYTPGPLVLDNSPLPSPKSVIAKQLLQDLPSYLLDHPDQTFGCPDCRDQGAIHIEYVPNTASDLPYIAKWHIDTDTSAIPVEIRKYTWQVMNAISELEKF